jgi:sporulation protein YlmC with PRC-barrel domain
MSRIALALFLAAVLAAPAVAQKKDESRIPSNTFFKGQQSNQFLARERFLGAKVVNKDGQTVGSIDDLIIGSSGQIEGIILGVGGFLGVGEKKIGVRMGALKVTSSDGKTTIAFPSATKEMLGAVEAYQRASGPGKK